MGADPLTTNAQRCVPAHQGNETDFSDTDQCALRHPVFQTLCSKKITFSAPELCGDFPKEGSIKPLVMDRVAKASEALIVAFTTGIKQVQNARESEGLQPASREEIERAEFFGTLAIAEVVPNVMVYGVLGVAGERPGPGNESEKDLWWGNGGTQAQKDEIEDKIRVRLEILGPDSWGSCEIAVYADRVALRMSDSGGFTAFEEKWENAERAAEDAHLEDMGGRGLLLIKGFFESAKRLSDGSIELCHYFRTEEEMAALKQAA